MADDPIVRVQADLETVRKAAGLELPFGREDIIMDLLLAAGMVVLGVVWSLFGVGPGLRVGAYLYLGLSVAGVIYLRLKYRRSSGRPSMRRREYTIGLLGALLLFAGLMTFFRLSLKYDVQRPHVYAAVFASMGLGYMLVGIVDPARRRYLAAAVFGYLLAVAIPVFWDGRIVLAVVAVGTVTCLADAAIMTWQLRKARASL
ncbi:MAG: hypothetical protein WC869_08755 [Phycisphaerae bacterium]|jgi:hypothetical protein